MFRKDFLCDIFNDEVGAAKANHDFYRYDKIPILYKHIKKTLAYLLPELPGGIYGVFITILHI